MHHGRGWAVAWMPVRIATRLVVGLGRRMVPTAEHIVRRHNISACQSVKFGVILWMYAELAQHMIASAQKHKHDVGHIHSPCEEIWARYLRYSC